MTQEPAFRANSSPSSCSPIEVFFAIPNPQVIRLLIFGSAATLSLGIAMTVEWSLHAKHHPGYEWLVYWAALAVTLPNLAWTVLILSASLLRGGAPSPEGSRAAGSADSISPRPRLEVRDEEVKCEEIFSSDHEQRLVQNEGFGDHVRAYGSATPANGSRVPSKSLRTAVDVKIAFGRTFSLPAVGNAREYRDVERRLSSRL